ncbi:MAG: hypothetical protein ABL932_25960 [Terricaulis sp.]
MFEALIAPAGLSYFVAVSAIFVAALIAKAGAPRAPNEEPSRRGLIMATLAFASALTPAIVMLYGYAITRESSAATRIVLMTMPVAAGFLGSLLGALMGLTMRDARAMFRMASIVTGFGALIVALCVALPQLDPIGLVSAAEAFSH